MAGKKQQNRIKSVERMDVQLVQLALRLDLAKKALGVDERRERVAELCEIGGDYLSVDLGSLTRAERLGAFMILAEMAKNETFLEECRRRSAAGMARRQEAKDLKKAGKRRKRRKPEIVVDSVEPAPVQSEPSVAPTAPTVSDVTETLIVRFSGPIVGLGSKLKSLGLTYDRDRREWTGRADRAAVEAEINASPCAPLLKDISSAISPIADTLVDPPATRSAVGWWPQLRTDDVGEVEVEA